MNVMKNTRAYTEYCPGGFIISPHTLSEYPQNWDAITFFNFTIYCSKSTKINHVFKGKKGVAIIGDSYDLNIKNDDQNFILEKIFFKLHNSFEEALEYIQYLAGRYLIILYDDEALFVIPDSHCTLGCYASQEKEIVVSHFQLAKDYLHLAINELTQQIMKSPDYIAPGGKSLPALLTPCDDLFPLIANCYLMKKDNQKFMHKRFYPTISLQEKFKNFTDDQKYEIFKETLINYLKLSYKPGISYISLTNGLDSRSVLAAAILAELKYDAFTYTREGKLSKDALGASRLAYYTGYPHFLVILPTIDYSSQFYHLYRRNFSLSARFPSLAQAYYEQLPDHASVLISTISETGTCFYKDRKETEITASLLAKKWSYSKINKSESVIKSFENYIEYTQFFKDKILDYCFYDLFYWEHRNSRWANIWYQECDLSHEILLPFNARLINEIMLSFSEKKRREKYILLRLIEESGLPSSGDYFVS